MAKYDKEIFPDYSSVRCIERSKLTRDNNGSYLESSTGAIETVVWGIRYG